MFLNALGKLGAIHLHFFPPVTENFSPWFVHHTALEVEKVVGEKGQQQAPRQSNTLELKKGIQCEHNVDKETCGADMSNFQMS